MVEAAITDVICTRQQWSGVDNGLLWADEPAAIEFTSHIKIDSSYIETDYANFYYDIFDSWFSSVYTASINGGVGVTESPVSYICASGSFHLMAEEWGSEFDIVISQSLIDLPGGLHKFQVVITVESNDNSPHAVRVSEASKFVQIKP